MKTPQFINQIITLSYKNVNDFPILLCALRINFINFYEKQVTNDDSFISSNNNLMVEEDIHLSYTGAPFMTNFIK